MITHVVFFKLKDRSIESVKKAAEVLRSLEGSVPQLRHIEVGIDALKTDRSYDIALITRFDSLEDLDKYQNHPFHLEVADYIGKVKESVVAVDYETKQS